MTLVTFSWGLPAKGTVMVTLKRAPRELRLTVSDDGQGLDPGRADSGLGGRLVDGIYPWIATLVDPWEVTSLEFLDPDSSVYALRPRSPLEVTWGFYSPNASFCYPGGEFPLS